MIVKAEQQAAMLKLLAGETQVMQLPASSSLSEAKGV